MCAHSPPENDSARCANLMVHTFMLAGRPHVLLMVMMESLPTGNRLEIGTLTCEFRALWLSYTSGRDSEQHEHEHAWACTLEAV